MTRPHKGLHAPASLQFLLAAARLSDNEIRTGVGTAEEREQAIAELAPLLRRAEARSKTRVRLTVIEFELWVCAQILRRRNGGVVVNGVVVGGALPNRKSGRPAMQHEHLLILMRVENRIDVFGRMIEAFCGKPKPRSARAQAIKETAREFGRTYGAINDLYKDHSKDPEWRRLLDLSKAL